MLIPNANRAYVCLCKFRITLLFSKRLLHFSNYWQFKCVNVSDKAYIHIYMQTHVWTDPSWTAPSILVPYENSSNHSQQNLLFRVKWSQTNCPSMISLFLHTHSQWYACLHIHIMGHMIKEKSNKNLDLLLKLKTPSTISKRPFIKTNLQKTFNSATECFPVFQFLNLKWCRKKGTD